nr:DUF1499 domain-containing protein [Roseobacter sp. CCS2]
MLTVLVVLILGLMAYVRFAPTDAARWHQPLMLTAPGDYPEEGGFLVERKIAAPAPEVLAAVESRALATPRTQVIAGSVDEGMITFMTRSRVMGFPDYTTVAVYNDTLVIYGRLRFGRSDMGVNKARIESWLETLGPLTEPL